jgi:hypothetical protein
LVDEPSEHFPDRIEIELHIDPANLATSTGFSIPLYRDEKSIWRQGLDSAGGIDVSVIGIECSALPARTVYCAFTPEHLLRPGEPVEIGTPLLSLYDTVAMTTRIGRATSFGVTECGVERVEHLLPSF